ncbi:hypothetical protein [Paraburkholderia sp. MM5482-R1]|uniref:hypothetical protein n=1 Tax=unclassified Paraburkholderia TaxID=2615204 RepID=UPI003D1CFCD2
MSKLTDSINTFVTGDLVFTRYPPTTRQPIHVTVFLEPRHGLGRSYVHAGAQQLEIADVATYADDKGAGGYLHAHPTDNMLRSRTAEIAQMFAQNVKRTPYGNYPSSADFQRLQLLVESPHASRFTGMVRTTDFGQIPFEFPALVRLLKWTLRAIDNAPLSENRGITCAAFVSICHQVARMLIFFDDVGLTWQPEKIRNCLQKLNGLVESKASLRAELEKIGEDPTRNNKPIYRDQAYREHSNRKLTPAGKSELASKRANVAYDSVPDEARKRLKKNAPSSELEGYWLVIQTEWLGINAAITKSLQDILGDFFFDAKYVSSPILSQRVQTIGWRTVAFNAY